MLLGRREHPAAIVERRTPLQMTSCPRRAQLSAIPLAIRRTRQSLVPDLKVPVEDALEDVAFGRNDGHAGKTLIVAVTVISADVVSGFGRTC